MRIVLAVVVATVLMFITDGVLHEVVIKQAWADLFVSLNNFKPVESKGSMTYFLLFEIGRAIIAVLFYVMMKEGGWKAAAQAGVLSWVAFSLLGPVQMIPLGLFSVDLWWRMAGYQLVTSVLATMAASATKPRQ